MLCACGCGKETPLAKRTDKQKGWIEGQPLRYIRYHWKLKPWKDVPGIPFDDPVTRKRLMNNRRAKAWYWKHHERTALISQLPHIKAFKQQWRLQNKARLNAMDRERYWKDPEANRRAAKEYRKHHAEQCRATIRRWFSEHKEYAKVHGQRYLAKKRANGGTFTVEE
jgi:hypothetical protein